MNTFVPPKLYGIIGDPVGHSLSPLLHSTAFALLGIPGVLLPWRVEPDRLPSFVEAVRVLDIQGSCVTIPHKEAIIPLLDGISECAGRAGSVNLVHRRENLVLGDNTDIAGFISPLAGRSFSGATALILGTGGTTRSVAVGLKTLGVDAIAIAGRNVANRAALAREFALAEIGWDARGEATYDIIVNTTPLGMRGENENKTPYPGKRFSGKTGLVYDVIYTPAETRFLREAREAGWRTVNGWKMFVEQANRQFQIWTGASLPSEAVRAAEEAVFGKR